MCRGMQILKKEVASVRSNRWQAILFPFAMAMLGALLMAGTAAAQDPAEPPGGAPKVELLPRPTGRLDRASIDENLLRAIIEEQVACGTRDTFSSWTDPKRGIGCGRDRALARFQEIAKESGGRLQVVVDKFDMTLRTGEQAHLENVYAILPGSDPALAKTVFITSGDFDSRPSEVNDPNADAPGADDDSSGVAVAIESARLLAKGTYRATLIFAALSGEEQGLLGAQAMLKYLQGITATRWAVISTTTLWERTRRPTGRIGCACFRAEGRTGWIRLRGSWRGRRRKSTGATTSG